MLHLSETDTYLEKAISPTLGIEQAAIHGIITVTLPQEDRHRNYSEYKEGMSYATESKTTCK